MTASADKPPVICLMGPTAVGKTALAQALHESGRFQLLSVDSAQVYRGMDIGTSKPDAATLARYPHRLIDIRDPAEPYSAAGFRADALREITTIQHAGSVPLLVGGTMLYFKALRDGLADMPAADYGVRRRIEARAAVDGWPAVHAWLAEVDPAAAARIHPNDPQRLQRALEVYLLSGRSMTLLHGDSGPGAKESDNSLPFSLGFFAIQPPNRTVLHEKIAVRFRQMLRDGLVEEVQALHRRGDLSESLPSIKSVGYRQIWQYLEGHLDYDGMVERSIIATRQLAKRQLTWLRGWEGLQILCDSQAESVATILKYVESTAT